jgi:hypothetical protein
MSNEFERAECIECGKTFGQTSSSHMRCPPCFKEDCGYNLLTGDKNVRYLQNLLLGCEEELQEAQMKYDELKNKYNGLVRAYKRLKAPPPPPPPEIEPSVLSDLLRLCHPDKHKQSERSRKVTAWLLEQR